MSPMTITLIILFFTAVAFMSGKVPFPLVSVVIMLSLLMTGVSTPQEAFANFTNTNVIMFVAMFVVGEAITRTSLLDRISGMVTKYKNNPRKLILFSCIAAVLFSVLTSATPTTAVLVPVLIGISKEIGFSRKRLLYPAISCANIAVAMTFLGAGASNMTFSSMIIKAGGKIPFTVWDFTIAKLPTVIIAVIYMAYVGYKLLPDDAEGKFEEVAATKGNGKKFSPTQEKIAIIIIVITVIAMLLATPLKIQMYLIACVAAVALVVLRTLTANEALAAIHQPTIFLFAGVLALSDAIAKTGAGALVAKSIVKMLGNTSNPYIIMAAFVIIPFAISQFMSNLAVVFLFTPLAAAAAIQLGLDPRAAAMGTMVAANISLLTPMAAPPQAMIYGIGGYTIKDYLKCGLPLCIILLAFLIFYLPIVLPF